MITHSSDAGNNSEDGEVNCFVIVLRVMLFADRDVISYTASILPIVSIFLVMESIAVCTLFVISTLVIRPQGSWRSVSYRQLF